MNKAEQSLPLWSLYLGGRREDRQETKQISSMCTRQVISNKGERERRNVQVVYGRFRCEGQERSSEKVTHGQRLEGSEVSHSDI